MDKGVPASPSGHSDEPASGLAAIAGSVPNACPHCGGRFCTFSQYGGPADAPFNPAFIKRGGVMCRECDWVAVEPQGAES